MVVYVFFFFQAEDGIRDAQESRGLGDVYKRQAELGAELLNIKSKDVLVASTGVIGVYMPMERIEACLLYTSDAADDLLCVDLGGRRIIKKKKHISQLLTAYNTMKHL